MLKCKTRIIITIVFFISIASKTQMQSNNLPEPYKSINLLPLDNHGWFGAENQQGLLKIIKKVSPTVVVEVGSWLGLSTIFIAKELKSNSKIYAVDNWLGQSYYNANTSQEILSRLYKSFHQFLSNVIHHKQTDKIIPIRMKSLEAAAALNITPELVYIDGSHVEQDVYEDVLVWYKKLAIGGILCGDDWYAPEVKSGVSRAAAKLNLEINADGNFWYVAPKLVN